jgi:AraC family transcriptional regulator
MVRLGPAEYFSQIVARDTFGPLAITTTRYRSGEILPRHYHAQPYLFVMLAGAFREQTTREDYHCTRGWLVFNAAGEPHCDDVLAPGTEGLNVELPPDWLPASYRGQAGCEPFLSRFAGPAITAVGALQLALRVRDGLSTLGVQEAVTRLLDSLCRPVPSRGRSPRWLYRVEQILRDRYQNGLCLRTVAAEAGVHPAHLCREFRRTYGCTMTQYAARLRGDEALTRLIGSTDTLAHIAAEMGFADQAHLTRTIRNLYGSTPARLRREPA